MAYELYLGEMPPSARFHCNCGFGCRMDVEFEGGNSFVFRTSDPATGSGGCRIDGDELLEALARLQETGKKA